MVSSFFDALYAPCHGVYDIPTGPFPINNFFLALFRIPFSAPYPLIPYFISLGLTKSVVTACVVGN